MRQRVMAALVLLGFLLHTTNVQATRDVLGAEPPVTKPDLVVHPTGTDLSAYRLDSEVFGWDREFTQVAALGDEVYRGPKGKQRGEAYMLVYNVGETVPVHNVILHTITHADLPHNPVPIEDARDLTWALEASFLGMWPKRPLHKKPKGGMEVETIWEPFPQGNDLCTPGVGFLLTWHGKKRFQPFQQLDMKVHCPLLRQTDSRIYWGRKDIAANMVRFDFSPNETNEKSARFVVSASWKMAKEASVLLEVAAPLPAAEEKHLRQQLSKLGHLKVRRLPRDPAAHDDTPGISQIAAKTDYVRLGSYLARTLRAAGTSRIEGDNGADLVVHVGFVGATKIEEPPPKPAPTVTQNGADPNAPKPVIPPEPVVDPKDIDAAAKATVHIGAPPQPSPMPPAAPPPATPIVPVQPQPTFLQDWQP